jgi:hypothetical protein
MIPSLPSLPLRTSNKQTNKQTNDTIAMNNRKEFVRRASTDAGLRQKPFSIRAFKRKAEKIRRDEDNDAWLEFGIAGIHAERNYRAKIDMEPHQVTQDFLNTNPISRRQDYDSLIGRCDKLPFAVPVEIYPLFKSGFKITKSLHIDPKPLRQPRVSASIMTCSIPRTQHNHI